MKKKLLIQHGRLLTPAEEIENAAIFVEDGKINRIGPAEKVISAVVNKADEIVDAGGMYLAPGFIDLHFHGMLDYLVDNGPKDVEQLTRELPKYGVTGFLPTLCPLPEGKDAEFVNELSSVRSAGTEILGFFMEGPFLGLPGALPKDALGKPDKARVRALIEAAKPYTLIFAVGPEVEGVLDVLPLMAADNTPVFITHTAATAEQTKAAIALGVCHSTHCYNVHPHPEVTEPGRRPAGTIEAIFADPKVSVDYILDGEHVEPVAVEMGVTCKGPDRVSLITDANLGTGKPPGRYIGLGGAEVAFAYPGAPARGTENSSSPGGLTGSGLTMDLGVRNAVKMLGASPAMAVRMASANPAKVLRLDYRKGWLKEGYDADIVLLDRDMNVRTTWIGGEQVFGG